MKYLKKRAEFLVENKISLPKPINKNEINLPINESAGPMTNEIPWGDSLIGRLINSFIRTAKIKFNATKVENLLKDFKAQLDIILSESLSRDTRSEFIVLTIKSLLNDVERTCTSTKTEEEKLTDLLGKSDDSLWNPKKPNRGSFTENVDDGIMIKIHEKIKFDLDENQIEVAGVPKDDLLGAISELIDDLREYAWSLNNNGKPSSQSKNNKKSFALRFKGLMNKVKKPVVAENYNYNLIKGYYDFIKESNEVNSNKLIKNIINILINMYNVYINDKQRSIKTIESVIQKNTEDLLLSIFSLIEKQSDSFKNFNYDKLYNSILHIHRKGEDSSKSELSNMIYLLYKNGNVNDIDKSGKLKNSDKLKKLFTDFKSVMDNLIKISEKSKDGDKQPISSGKDKTIDYINLLLNIEDSNNDKIEEIVQKIPIDKKRELLDSILKDEKSDDDDKKEAKELIKELEKIKESFYYIKEAISSNDTTVLDIWEGWIKDKGIPENMVIISQQEIDKLEEMIKGEKSGQNLTFNPKKTPDPIINIVRIFKRAHDLYFTEVIPSGRSRGKVSNKTFREYEKLGTGQTSQSDADAPGYGPWAVKSIRNKWVDGVNKIIEDQEYRKIFANTKFVVAGSEDTFNDSMNYNNYIHKILEDKETDSKKSQGQILFDFITDMLNKETAADFDKQRDILLKKYFGNSVEIKGSDMKPVNSAPNPSKPRDPIEDKTIYWEPISQKGVNISKLSSDDQGPIIIFPYKNITGGSANTEILKFQVIQEIDGKDKDNKDVTGYIIKTFDKLTNTDFYKKDYNKFKITNDDETGKYDANINYAIIYTGPIKEKNIKSNKKFNIIFYDTNGSKVTSPIEIQVSDKSLNGTEVPSILYKKDKSEEQLNIEYKTDITSIENSLRNEFKKEIKK